MTNTTNVAGIDSMIWQDNVISEITEKNDTNKPQRNPNLRLN